MTPPRVALDLHPSFRPPADYRLHAGAYRLLPFRFERLDGERYVLTNFAGDFICLPRSELEDLVAGRLAADSHSYATLVARQFIIEAPFDSSLEVLAAQYRTRNSTLDLFTGLHIFVVTLRCEHSCPYCQVSRVTTNRTAFDMSLDTARRAVDLVFQGPSPTLKIEFQGGEPLLNFDLIKEIVGLVEAKNEAARRSVEFVIATNLALLSDTILDFCREHSIRISTSLDGPKDLHNLSRPRPGGDSYERAVAGVLRCREVLGPYAVSALMTTTAASLEQPEAIIDEYVRLGFGSVFLRWLSPFGYAKRTSRHIGYDTEAWCRFYERGLGHILALNAAGTAVREEYASIVLRKILTPFASGYVDLRSPTGLGIGVAVYNYDGSVYASDEARMLAETGDQTFRLGDVHSNTFEELFGSERLLDVVLDTMTEGIPMCAECGFEPYCGTDPAFHHATQGDMVGHRPTSSFCKRNLFVFRTLLRILEDEPVAARVLRSWAT